MRRKLSLAFGGVLLAVALALYSLPARLMPLFVDAEVLRLSGISGTLLNGRAARAIVTTSAGPVHLGSFRWRFKLRSLLALEPTLSLKSEWGAQRIQLRISRAGDTLHVSKLDANLSAGLARQFAPVALDGRLSMVFDELTLAGGRLVNARGRVVWQDALWLAPRGARPLGSYAGEVTTASAGEAAASVTELAVTTLSGPLYATGSASLSGSRYSTDIRLDGGDGPLDPDLSRAISLLAVPENTGYRLRLSGDLGSDL